MLTNDEKEKCAQLFEWATDERTNPNDWHESAADVLAEMYAEILTCSSAMNLVPRPPGMKPGWGWLIKYVYDVVSRSGLGGRFQVYEACRVVRGAQYKRVILIELATGGN